MGCCGGGKSIGNCCLCSRAINAGNSTPWGKGKKICSHCKKKQLELIKERERLNKRAKILMEGRNFK